jgi:hypothetical protein
VWIYYQKPGRRESPLSAPRTAPEPPREWAGVPLFRQHRPIDAVHIAFYSM